MSSQTFRRPASGPRRGPLFQCLRSTPASCTLTAGSLLLDNVVHDSSRSSAKRALDAGEYLGEAN